MAATKQDIRRWFTNGQEHGATYMIVVCDTFDYGDYPVYVYKDQNPREVAKKFDGVNMQKIMEVYSLSMDMEDQLSAHRVHNYD